jgi:predicted HAD superfamily Cof-like phosphohydrolase
MEETMSSPEYQMAKEFHGLFDPRIPKEPTAFTTQEASFRAGFKVEEIVEFLYASCQQETQPFETLVNQLHQDVEKAHDKVLAKGPQPADQLTGQVDALTDLLYFVHGSFALMGIDPTEIYKIVHRANMGKLFPDGRPHYDPVTNKVLKPANWQADFAPEQAIKKELERQKKSVKSN